MKTKKMFLIKCPHCHHKMKYMLMSKTTTGKNKKCVYCGKNIVIDKNIVKILEEKF